MSRPLVIDLFVEDTAHAEFLVPLTGRIAGERKREVDCRVRSAQGGQGRALAELELYQGLTLNGLGGGMPDLLVVGIDANCRSLTAVRNEILGVLDDRLRECCVPACPDPHVERWYLADLEAFHSVVGITPSVPRDKCERGFYKQILARAVVDGGHPPMLGGIEFASDLVAAMDLFRAGRTESSLKHFADGLSGRLKLL
jgi:hypothetical protein